MPDWKEVTKEIDEENGTGGPLDKVRRKYLRIMSEYTGRNVIAYYSGFMQKSNRIETAIDNNDVNAFMQAIHKMDKTKGLDLIIHTPGGDLAAAQSIVDYLHLVFDKDVRAFVPQLSMSAGTMIALSCKEIIMGKQSALGPIDPQFGGVSCSGVIEEFDRACADVKKDPSCIPLWQIIISKYRPAFIGDCEKAIKWGDSITTEWLKNYMFNGDEGAEEKAKRIVENLSDHSKTCYHGRQYHYNECENLGIKVTRLEEMDPTMIEGCVDLQDCVLTIHHAYMQTFAQTDAVKIVENSNGNAMIVSIA